MATPLFTVSCQILHLSSAEMLCVGMDPPHPCHAIRAGMQVLGMGGGAVASALIVAHTGSCLSSGWQDEIWGAFSWLFLWLKRMGLDCSTCQLRGCCHSVPHESSPVLQFTSSLALVTWPCSSCSTNMALNALPAVQFHICLQVLEMLQHVGTPSPKP